MPKFNVYITMGLVVTAKNDAEAKDIALKISLENRKWSLCNIEIEEEYP
jgi:hypothetical protein